MPALYCIWALIFLVATPAWAQQAQAPATRTTGFSIFLQGSPIGHEDVATRDDANGLVISAQARRSPPAVAASGTVEVRYRPDGEPESSSLESTTEGVTFSLRTRFADNTAISEGRQGDKPITKTDPVSPRTLVLPTGYFGPHVALGRRLATLDTGGEVKAYLPPYGEVPVKITATASSRIQTGTTTLDVRSYDLTFANPNGPLVMILAVDSSGALVSIRIPSQSLDVVRDDVSTATTRTLTHSNPGDEPVTIPAAGFNLGATLTRPASGTGRLPAVILVPGSGVGDRDGVVSGVPTLGQLAGVIADAGFIAVRFDKRGYGQSGGRAESATLNDFAEDAISVMKWLSARRDVDNKRIAIMGHSEGAWVALLAAAREKRLAAVVAIAAPSVTGSELVLEQQRLVLDRLNAEPADRQAKVELQTRINAAVVSGRGWEGIPEDVKRQADTPWFQSLLTFDPARVLKDVRQPTLFVHGELDMQVPVSHVERISDLARKQSKSKSVAVVTVRGANHLLVPAVTGAVEEYATLPDRNVSKEATAAISDWLTRTFAAVR
jgi:pimeloyl-ACP methyl ester carboxylesterase